MHLDADGFPGTAPHRPGSGDAGDRGDPAEPVDGDPGEPVTGTLANR